MRNKALLIFWVNLVNLVLMLGLMGTSIILKWVLPHGSGGGQSGRGMGWRGGRGAPAEWLDLTRHQWGDVHFYLAIALIAGIAAFRGLRLAFERRAEGMRWRA